VGARRNAKDVEAENGVEELLYIPLERAGTKPLGVHFEEPRRLELRAPTLLDEGLEILRGALDATTASLVGGDMTTDPGGARSFALGVSGLADEVRKSVEMVAQFRE
jgi:hypothetical protein